MGVIRFDNKPIGMVVAHGKPIFGTPGQPDHLSRDRSGFMMKSPGEMQKLALGLLRKRYRLRNARPVTFHPELADTPAHRHQLLIAGFKRIAEGYANDLA